MMSDISSNYYSIILVNYILVDKKNEITYIMSDFSFINE